MTGIRRIYVEPAGIGWRIVAEASPDNTGLPLWTAARRWRLTHAQALRVAARLGGTLDESIAYHRERLLAKKAQRQIVEEE